MDDLSWFDIALLSFLVFGVCAAGLCVAAAIWWFISGYFERPPRGERRIVDVDNRGETRIMMPDGTIK
jgi:hypothetical protein